MGCQVGGGLAGVVGGRCLGDGSIGKGPFRALVFSCSQALRFSPPRHQAAAGGLALSASA